MSVAIYEILLVIGGVAGVLVAVSQALPKLKQLALWMMKPLMAHRKEMTLLVAGVNEKLMGVSEKLEVLAHEMKPNSGLSLRDAINRIETRQVIFEQRQRAVLTDSALGVFETDQLGGIIWVNRKFCRILGRTTEELLHYGWLNSVPSDQRDTVHELWLDAVKDDREFHMDFPIATPEGVIVPVHVRSIRMLDKEQRLAGYIGFLSVVGANQGADPAGL